jgi:CO/xanthine dehydrogenase Mo-binding subunit
MPSQRRINTVIPKIGAEDLALGRSHFSGEMRLEDRLVLRVLRSRVSHARIRHLDITGGLEILGAVGILTARDIPDEDLYG